MVAEEQPMMPYGRTYCPQDLFDTSDNNEILGTWRNATGLGAFEDLTRIDANNACRNATKQRDLLRYYFISPLGEQEAPWQYSCAFRGLILNNDL